MGDPRGVLVIVGAGSGMGEAAVRQAVERYSTIVAIDRDAAALDRLSTELGTDAVHVRVCDITVAGELKAVASGVMSALGPVDALLNFAGVSEFGAAADITLDVWERQIAINLTGTFLACQTFGREMIARRSGAIVNVASTAGVFGVPAMAAYTAAKHGVVGLTRALAIEWAQFGVRVNCICPGATLTSMLLATTEEFRASRSKRIPLARFGTAAEQAAVALFLASADAAYVTGAIVPVDGGIAAMAPGTAESALRSAQ